MVVHPSLSQIAERERAVAYWDAKDRGGRRVAGLFSVGSAGLAVLVGMIATSVPVLWIVTGLLAAWSGLCAHIWWTDPPLKNPRPSPLGLVAFTAAENRGLIRAQPPQPFEAFAVCPGCGYTQAHLIREPVKGEPGRVIRHCDVCEREWSQA